MKQQHLLFVLFAFVLFTVAGTTVAQEATPPTTESSLFLTQCPEFIGEQTNGRPTNSYPAYYGEDVILTHMCDFDSSQGIVTMSPENAWGRALYGESPLPDSLVMIDQMMTLHRDQDWGPWLIRSIDPISPITVRLVGVWFSFVEDPSGVMPLMMNLGIMGPRATLPLDELTFEDVTNRNVYGYFVDGRVYLLRFVRDQETVCGNAICESPETTSSCSMDCQ